MKKKHGFTLIEMTVVIVLLGILAMVAIPKFVDLRSDAYQSSINAMAGSFTTASAVNASSCTATGNVATTGAAITVNKCSSVAALINPPVSLGAAGVAIDNTYNLVSDNLVSDGEQATCILQYLVGGVTYNANYVVIGAC